MPTAIAENTNPTGHGANDVRTRAAPVEAATCALGNVFTWMLACLRIHRLPESLWQAAVELARQYGIYAVAHLLRLDYTRLKQRLNGISATTGTNYNTGKSSCLA
jgi:hypothetical protein